jgi:tetratricopeptide (TPR) repeat protein
MPQKLLIFAMIIGVGLQLDPALGQKRLSQQRLQNAAQERRERRQAEALVDEGAKLLKAGRIVLAAEKFRRALQFDAENDRAHAYLAQIAWDERRVEIAKSHAVQALKSNPQNTRAHLIAGEILLQEGKTLAAFDHLRKAAANVSDDQEKRKAGNLLANLREKNPAWFGKATTSAAPSISVASTAAKPPSPPATNTVSTAPAKPLATGVRPNLAVFTFDEMNTQQPVQPGWGASLAEMLTTALINSGSYRIIERKQLQRVLEEQALGQTGALDSETAVVVGKIMSLDAVVVGSLSSLTSALEADARILNVETGEAIAATHSRAASADELRQMAEALAKEISNRAVAIPLRAQVDTTASSKK